MNQNKPILSTYHCGLILAGMTAACILTAGSLFAQSSKADPRDDASPWGAGSGGEWAKDYPKFNPFLNQAGARWIRVWPEWNTIQPEQGQWNWERADKIVADAKTNHLHPLGIWYYFAKWASADGGMRKGPIKDIQYWKDYVTASVKRYKGDVKYWEVWNEFNGSFYEGRQGADRVKDYADLVSAAYDAAKKADPTARVGMSVANFDVNFLNDAIKAGAAGHFDFICVHPYENFATVAQGGEVGYLSLAKNLRDMLKANNQDVNTPLWITEMGCGAPVKPDLEKDALQAAMFTKGYLLSLAQGFSRIFWFEVRGPADTRPATGPIDFNLIRADWTPRPSYDAMKTMTALMGAEPRYLGWMNIAKVGYGFVFKGKNGNVLAAWAPPGKEFKTTFNGTVNVVDLEGKATVLPAGKELPLTNAPVFITGIPADLAEQAQANQSKPYPWGGDYANAKEVSCRLGAVNNDKGLTLVNQKTTQVVNDLTETCRRTDISNPALKGAGNYVHFRVDPLFVPFGTRELKITVVAKRLAPDKAAGTGLQYESVQGYRNVPDGWWTIPAGDQWQEHTWKVNDANFVGQWGFNFRINAVGTHNDFLIKEVRVEKMH